MSYFSTTAFSQNLNYVIDIHAKIQNFLITHWLITSIYMPCPLTQFVLYGLGYFLEYYVFHKEKQSAMVQGNDVNDNWVIFCDLVLAKLFSSSSNHPLPQQLQPPSLLGLLSTLKGFLVCSGAKESACNAGDPGLIPELGRSPGEGNGYPLWYSCLENPIDRGAWWAIVHGVTELDMTNTHCFESPSFSCLPEQCGEQ